MTKYTPAWKGDDGNRVVTPVGKLVFDNEQDALLAQHYVEPIYGSMGLKPDGTFPFEVEQEEAGTFGKFQHVHLEGMLRAEFLAVSGPALDQADELDRCEGIGLGFNEQRPTLN